MKMTTQEIIQNNPHLEDYGVDWKQLYYNIYQLLDSGKYKMIRHNNTLFLYEITSQDVAKLAVFNADSYKSFLRNCAEFFKAMQVAGFKTIYGDTSDINIFNVAKKQGWNVKTEKIGKDKKGSTMYRGVGNVMR